jgi:hypothetical protein
MAILQPVAANISSNNPQPIVGQVVVTQQTKKNNTFYSSKLLNFVEPVEIDGVDKTVFYTEVNTNVNIGDRIFILNGNYDSNRLNLDGKYKKYTDGYRVLDAKGCRIVLDINYTGQLPFEPLNSDNFIFVRHIQNQKDFDYINSLKICIGEDKFVNPYGGTVDGKIVSLSTQNFIFTTSGFQGNSDEDYYNKGIIRGGFYCRDGSGKNNDWIDITNYFKSGNIVANPEFTQSSQIFIVGEDFEIQEMGLKFTERNVYEFINLTWVNNTKYYQPFVSKSIFRNGNFIGEFNDGIYGTYEKRNSWDGNTWKGGVLINTDWRSGLMDSKHTVGEESYSCRLQTIGTTSRPVEIIDTTNNRGFGYNFIEDSNFFQYTINNGNFKNCNFTFSTQKSALDIYYGVTSSDFNSFINGGKYDLCDLYSIKANGGYFLNSLINNSNFENSKLVSSETINCSLKNGFWSSEGGITIKSAELISLDKTPGLTFESGGSNIEGTLRLYISEEDYFKLNIGDTFYISNINKQTIKNLLTDGQRILHNIESRFIIENFDDYELVRGVKNPVKVTLNSSNENRWKFYASVPNVLTEYVYQIDGDNSDYWFKITSNSFKGLFDSNFNSEFYYKYNDVVYSNNKFYLFRPFYRNTAPSLIRRAPNQGEVQSIWDDGFFDFTGQFIEYNYQPTGLSEDPLYLASDWIFIGDYLGIWDKDGMYGGEYQLDSIVDGIIFATGSVVSDKETIIESNQFFVFVGGDEFNKSLITENQKDGPILNSFTTSNVGLPSIDITTNVFGWYLDGDLSFKPSTEYAISPINNSNVANIFTNTVLKNGNFVSGVIDDSTWISGDHINYSNNQLVKISSSNFYDIVLVGGSKKSLKINLTGRIYSNLKLFDGYDLKSDDYVWLKSLDYFDGTTYTNLDGRYKVVRYLNTSNQLEITCVEDQDILQPLVLGGKFISKNAPSNTYLSIHKLNIENSKIESGKFRRTGFDNCLFENKLFKKYVYPLDDLSNAQILRLVNVLFDGTGNEVKSGMMYQSHFVDDKFNGGTFYDSIWLGGTFSDGLFKYSVWTGGNFNGGKFVDSRESTIFSFDFDTSSYNKLWQGGNFNGGEFFNSLWVRGTFNNGRFYKSDWTGGIWNGGVLGSKDYKMMDTTMAYYGPTTSFGLTYTVWNNGFVENAMVGGFGAIDWFDGKFSSGEFTSFDRTESRHSIWYDGEFFGGKFTKQAWWLEGSFNDGKFLSEIGWDKVNLNSESQNDFDYGWVNGEFNGGEFGNASGSTNSVWYNGIMQGGIFQGRYWKNGVLLGGKFYGSLVTQNQIHRTLYPFSQSFYGLWNNGYVTNKIYEPRTDLIITTNYNFLGANQVGQNQMTVDMFGVLWKSGTFSHELGGFNNSVWLDGEFNSGNFNNSYFNPFVDLTLSGYDPVAYGYKRFYQEFLDGLERKLFLLPGPKTIENIPSGKKISVSLPDTQRFKSSTSILITQILDYTADFELLDLKLRYGYFSGANGSYNNQSLIPGFVFDTTLVTPTQHLIIRIESEELLQYNPLEYIIIIVEYGGINTFGGADISVKYFYPKINEINPFEFNANETCVWTDGNFNGGEFYISKWKRGNFNDGLMTGAKWLDGTFNYGTMSNSYWGNGVWRNGTWNGSPFDHKSLLIRDNDYEIYDKKTRDIIYSVAIYDLTKKIHMNNYITKDEFIGENIEHTLSQTNLFSSWTYSIDE